MIIKLSNNKEKWKENDTQNYVGLSKTQDYIQSSVTGGFITIYIDENGKVPNLHYKTLSKWPNTNYFMSYTTTQYFGIFIKEKHSKSKRILIFFSQNNYCHIQYTQIASATSETPKIFIFLLIIICDCSSQNQTYYTYII